jgi:hypothetical protein
MDGEGRWPGRARPPCGSQKRRAYRDPFFPPTLSHERQAQACNPFRTFRMLALDDGFTGHLLRGRVVNQNLVRSVIRDVEVALGVDGHPHRLIEGGWVAAKLRGAARQVRATATRAKRFAKFTGHVLEAGFCGCRAASIFRLLS